MLCCFHLLQIHPSSHSCMTTTALQLGAAAACDCCPAVRLVYALADCLWHVSREATQHCKHACQFEVLCSVEMLLIPGHSLTEELSKLSRCHHATAEDRSMQAVTEHNALQGAKLLLICSLAQIVRHRTDDKRCSMHMGYACVWNGLQRFFQSVQV